MPGQAILFWSGGKDSAFALYEVQRTQAYDVVALVTTVTEDDQRIATHAVRRELLEQQAHELHLPLHLVHIPRLAANAVYEARLADALQPYRAAGITTVIFGDLFLEDIRVYREGMLLKLGMVPIFPLWGRDTAVLAREMIVGGFQALTVCVDTHALDARFVGCSFDLQFLGNLPAHVDPCGERGEFHSFVRDGPIFDQAIAVTTGQIELRDDRFLYCDLLPARAQR